MPRTIDDGQSLPLFIRGIPGEFDDFYAERRPTLPADRNRTMNRAKRADRLGDWAEHDAAHNELIVAKLTWWNVRGADDKPAPIDAASAARLPPNLWDRLTNVLLGFDYGDLAPDAGDAERAALAAAVQAIQRGEAPGDAAAEDSAKNS